MQRKNKQTYHLIDKILGQFWMLYSKITQEQLINRWHQNMCCPVQSSIVSYSDSVIVHMKFNVLFNLAAILTFLHS